MACMILGYRLNYEFLRDDKKLMPNVMGNGEERSSVGNGSGNGSCYAVIR